jgi:hypothetical protein
MKRIIEKRSNEAAVHLHLSAQHTCPQLSVYLSIICPFCISCHLQLSPIRFSSNNQELEKAQSKSAQLNNAQNI